jgi:hypothetical protein
MFMRKRNPLGLSLNEEVTNYAYDLFIATLTRDAFVIAPCALTAGMDPSTQPNEEKT